MAWRQAFARWPTGVYAVWYPLMTPGATQGFARDMVKTGIRKILRVELLVRDPGAGATIPGCGMLVINPPWKFDAEARRILDWIAPVLSQDGDGSARVDWLAPE